MSYNYGDIVVVRFPFALRNGSEIQKGRPALVISDDKVGRRPICGQSLEIKLLVI